LHAFDAKEQLILRFKGIVSKEEENAHIAILLHDISRTFSRASIVEMYIMRNLFVVLASLNMH
jgi:HD superfamily phosphohydrolase YqeK